MFLSKDIDNHIYISSRDLIKSKFNIDIRDNISKYYSIINSSRLYELEKYRFHGLISPTVFNICFLILTKDYDIEEKYVINILQKLVNKNRYIMENIVLPRNSRENNYKNNVLDRIKSSHSVKELDDILTHIKFDKEKYIKLVEQDSRQRLKYNEIIQLLIHKAKGIDKAKYEERYYNVLKEILNLVNDRYNYSTNYKEINSNLIIKNEVTVDNKKRCPKCKGTGYIDYYYYIDDGVCYTCEGRGILNYL